MRLHDIDISDQKIAEFCRRHGVKRLSVFGSVLRDDFGPHSDVDFVVEFLPGVRYSLLTLGGMWAELRELVGRRVDLKTPLEISGLFRDEVLAEARPLYAA